MWCKVQSLSCTQEHKRERRGKGIPVSLHFQKKYTSAAFSLWKRTLHKYPYKTILCHVTSTQVLQAAVLQLLVVSLWDNTGIFWHCFATTVYWWLYCSQDRKPIHAFTEIYKHTNGSKIWSERCSKTSLWKENFHLCDCSSLTLPCTQEEKSVF